MRAISLRSPAWDATPEDPATAAAPSFAANDATVDLHLDRVLAAAPDVAPLLTAPLRDPDAVAYRHEVFRDLETPALAEPAAAFVAGIASAGAQLAHAARLRHRIERARRTLEALDGYRATVQAFGEALDGGPVTSRGLAAVRDELRAYRSSEAFTRLTRDAARTLAALGGVTYRMRIGEHRIVVGRHDDEPDYGAQVAATLARFRTGDPTSRPPIRADRFETPDLNPLEAEILDKVARRHPAAFAALETFAADHGEAIETAAIAIAGDLRAYLGWLALIAPLREAGIAFCYPTVVGPTVAGGGPDARAGAGPDAGAGDGPDAEAGSRIEAAALVDLALALRHVPTGEPVVANDVVLGSGERLAVITGPNQAGKTTLARAIGQLVRLAAAGVPVPAASARLTLAGGVYTLFARAEDPADLTGRLEAELLRARAILDAAGPGSVVIINEAFASTTADDALALDRALLAELRDRGTTTVLVTFLTELARFDDATVSLGGIPDPDDPTRPTYRFARRPPDDLAHARVVAAAHHLDHDTVRRRVRR